MKKYLTVLALVVFSFFAVVNLSAVEPIDPSGNLSVLQDMEKNYNNSVARLLETIKLDYHPNYGVVKKEDLPCYEKGWDVRNLADYFPEGKVIDGAFVETTYTGVALSAHKAKDGKIFYAWHKYSEEPAVVMVADVDVDGKVGNRVAMAMFGCGNNNRYFLDGIEIRAHFALFLLKYCGYEIVE